MSPSPTNVTPPRSANVYVHVHRPARRTHRQTTIPHYMMRHVVSMETAAG